MKIEPDYDIETRHCIYGEDSDLVILGLCLHEPYMTLLKENRVNLNLSTSFSTQNVRAFCTAKPIFIFAFIFYRELPNLATAGIHVLNCFTFRGFGNKLIIIFNHFGITETLPLISNVS